MAAPAPGSAGLALLVLALPASAQGAVSLSVQASRAPATIFRGDEYMTYQVTVKNTGDTPTTPAANLSLDLPA